MNTETLGLYDASETRVAELKVTAEEDGWFYGNVVAQDIPPDLKKALDWYDEVVEHQMLSYLDKALASVARYGLHVRYADGLESTVFSLHITNENEVSFRTTPVPPPAWMSQSESA